MPKKLTKEIFIERANEIHKNKYDYSKVEYINQNINVTIICPIHGEFKQTPKNHLQGNGCPKCYNERRGKTLKKSTEQFIQEAKKIHGDKYDYSIAQYIDAHTKVCVICPKHGEFYIRPSNHLRLKQGCKKCANENSSKKKVKKQETFIKEIQKMYGDKYDFSLIKYVNNHTLVKVICKKHGVFNTKPNWLLSGHGCSECGKTLKKNEETIFNILKENFNNVEYQKKFDFLKSKTSYQTIDFYLPDFNVGVEYQGRQHFIPLKIFGGEESLIKTKERDLKKYNKCKKNGIKLYYITFENKKYIPENYFEKIYTNINELINDIKNT